MVTPSIFRLVNDVATGTAFIFLSSSFSYFPYGSDKRNVPFDNTLDGQNAWWV